LYIKNWFFDALQQETVADLPANA